MFSFSLVGVKITIPVFTDWLVTVQEHHSLWVPLFFCERRRQCVSVSMGDIKVRGE